MKQAFIDDLRVPVSEILAGPCVVTYIKKQEKDGYWAVQIGLGSRKSKNTPKPLQGHLKKSTNKQTFPRYLKEIRVEKEPKGITGKVIKVGDEIKISDIFSVGDTVSVTGVSKGKGFAGVMKRHGFAGGPKTHGQSDRQRSPGSIGQGTTPGRVYKGKKMAGRMGCARVTVKGLHVVSVGPDGNKIEVSGPIPGVYGGLVEIKRISRRREK